MNILKDENESSVYVKESAVSALGMLGDEKAVDSLVSILESKKGILDKFTFLKERALEALNKISFKGERVFNALVKSLRDESPQVRINAIEVLMNSEDNRAPDLIKGMLEDPNREVVQNAVIALYNLLDEDILKEIVQSENFTDVAKEEAVRLLDDLHEEDDEGNTDE
jgi:HEAT repeat protein